MVDIVSCRDHLVVWVLVDLVLLAVGLVVLVPAMVIEAGCVSLVSGMHHFLHLEGLQRIILPLVQKAAELVHLRGRVCAAPRADLLELHHLGLARREDNVLGAQGVEVVVGGDLEVGAPVGALVVVMDLDLPMRGPLRPLRLPSVHVHRSEVVREVQALLLHGVLVGQLVVSVGRRQERLHALRCVLAGRESVLLLDAAEVLVEK